MKIVCAPSANSFDAVPNRDLEVILYGNSELKTIGSIGASIKDAIQLERINPEPKAWDLLSIALSVIAADTAIRREQSPDGWTREIDLHIAVIDPEFWNTQRELIEKLLRFLTTDLWQCHFMPEGFTPLVPKSPVLPDENCVVLLSGGLDSLIGTVDLVTRENMQPYAISQIAQGNKDTQKNFAASIGSGLRHLQLNHNVKIPGPNSRTQRARSLIFLAYGIIAASSLRQYSVNNVVPLYICENGFISINPPLTDSRIGSLSTRTTHPIFIRYFQELLDACNLHIQIKNPYQFYTKGEMLKDCADQSFLLTHSHHSTSCGRFARHGYQHCGRCVPCLVRRSAFHSWEMPDKTTYKYDDLSRNHEDYAKFDDVRSLAMAIAQVRMDGINSRLGTSLNRALMGDVTQYKQTVERGLQEIANFLDSMGVK